MLDVRYIAILCKVEDYKLGVNLLYSLIEKKRENDELKYINGSRFNKRAVFENGDTIEVCLLQDNIRGRSYQTIFLTPKAAKDKHGVNVIVIPILARTAGVDGLYYFNELGMIFKMYNWYNIKGEKKK